MFSPNEKPRTDDDGASQKFSGMSIPCCVFSVITSETLNFARRTHAVNNCLTTTAVWKQIVDEVVSEAELFYQLETEIAR